MTCNICISGGCEFNVKTVGTCDVSRIVINGSDRTNLNWTEISAPEILTIPELKPDIEALDQVYANIVLNNTKLIETPFAYKKYVLFSFYTLVNGLPAIIPGLVSTLTAAVTALVTPALDTTLTDALDVLEAALLPLSGITGVPALITLVQGYQTAVTGLVNNINTAIAAVSTAADNLLIAIATVPFSPELICAAIQALLDTLAALTTLVNSIIGILTGMLNSLTAAAAAIGNPLVTAAVTTATGILTTLINTTLPPLITAVTNAINAIITALAPVDCSQSCAFELIPNTEGTCLSGRKLIVEGVLKQKIVYTAEVDAQSVHSAHFEVPFIAFIIPYAKFEGLVYRQGIEVYDPETGGSKLINGYICGIGQDITVDLCEEFVIEKCIEDIYVYALDVRRIFKNVTIFLKAKPIASCN